jgi:hypothetical protein
MIDTGQEALSEIGQSKGGHGGVNLRHDISRRVIALLVSVYDMPSFVFDNILPSQRGNLLSHLLH